MKTIEIPPELEEKLEPYQIELAKWLKRFREDICDFYLDGIKIFNSNQLKIKSNLLAHIAREIDGGIRDILSPEKEKQNFEKQLKNGNLGNITEINELKATGHVASILTALNCNLESENAKEWIDVATQFARMAHRDSSSGKIRDATEVKNLWLRYEKILLWLIGTYYNFLERIDRILKYDKPSEYIINSLNSILTDENLFHYFFTRLTSLGWIEPLENKGYFNVESIRNTYESKETPRTYTTPVWSPAIYLSKVAKINLESPNETITNILIKVVDSYINNYDKIDNSWADLNILEIIYNLPIPKIKEKNVEFIRTLLNSPNGDVYFISHDIYDKILPYFLESKNENLVLHLLDIILDYNNKNTRIEPLMEPHCLQKSLDKYKESIFDLCGIKSVNIALTKIKTITQKLPYEFQIAAVDDHHQNIFPDDYHCQMVHLIRDFLHFSNPKNIKNTLMNLIGEKNPIFKRIAIEAIDFYYDYEDDDGKLKELFWNWDGNPLEIDGSRHEIFVLLISHYSSFTETENQKLVDWIKNCNYYIPERSEYNETELRSYLMLKWLEAVKESDNREIQQLYQYCKKIYPDEIENPDFDSYIGKSGFLEPKEPLEICDKSNKDIADYLIQTCSGNPISDFVEDEIHGSLKICVKNNPNKFSNDLKPFLNVSRMNQYNILFGLWGAWKDGKFFEWDELLEFILKIIRNDSFWEDQFDDINYRDWIISEIADLIEIRTVNDDKPLKRDSIPKVCEILIILVNNTKTVRNDQDELVSSVINSPKGKIFMAMITFSLSYARRFKSKSQKRWLNPIKDVFTQTLEDPSVTEFYVILGLYLPNILYLDEKWFKENINYIFSEFNFKNVLNAYLHQSKVHEVIYKALRKNGVLEKSIYTDFGDSRLNDNLVYHICTAYVYDIENISDNKSLINKLINNRNPDQLSAIIRFFLLNRDTNLDRIKPKIRPLWKILIDIFYQNPDNYKECLSDISLWLAFYDEIDKEMCDWLLLSAIFLKINSNHRQISKYLVKCLNKSRQNVALIFIEMLKNGAYPDYPKEDIEKIVQTLYENGEIESANKICNLYGEKNYHFLRHLYKKYNESVY